MWLILDDVIGFLIYFDRNTDIFELTFNVMWTFDQLYYNTHLSYLRNQQVNLVVQYLTIPSFNIPLYSIITLTTALMLMLKRSPSWKFTANVLKVFFLFHLYVFTRDEFFFYFASINHPKGSRFFYIVFWNKIEWN